MPMMIKSLKTMNLLTSTLIYPKNINFTLIDNEDFGSIQLDTYIANNFVKPKKLVSTKKYFLWSVNADLSLTKRKIKIFINSFIHSFVPRK